MAIKSVIDVEVNDAEWEKFNKEYADFERAVGDLPDAWKKVDEAMRGVRKQFGNVSEDTKAILAGMGAMGGAIASSMQQATKAQHHFEREVKRSHRAMSGLEKSTGKVAHSIFSIGKTMLKWGAIGGGLAGLGGAIGLDDLAHGALSRQRSARGVGMTPGQQAAFNTYFSQFGNAQGVASNIANARNDVTKRWIFSGMGIGSKALANDSNFQLSILAEKRAQQMVKSYPRAEWANVANAMGLSQIFSNQDLRVLRHTSEGRMNAAAAGARSHAAALGFSPKVAREWSNLSVQLHEAGVQIETSLVKGLHKLAPELSILSKDISNGISAFANGPEMKLMVSEMESGMKKFAQFINSSSFHKQLADFEQHIGTAASELAAIAKGLLPYAKAAGWVAKKTVGAAGAVAHGAEAGFHDLENGYRDVRRWIYGSRNNPGNLMHRNKFGGYVLNSYATPQAGMAAMSHLLQEYPSKYHADTIRQIVQHWAPASAGNDDAAYIANVSKWSGYKADQHLDLSNKAVRDAIMAAMIRQEHGHKVTPGQVQSTLHGGGTHETNKHLAQTNKLLQRMARQGLMKPTVTIQDKTSARLAIIANAAAY